MLHVQKCTRKEVAYPELHYTKSCKEITTRAEINAKKYCTCRKIPQKLFYVQKYLNKIVRVQKCEKESITGMQK